MFWDDRGLRFVRLFLELRFKGEFDLVFVGEVFRGGEGSVIMEFLEWLSMLSNLWCERGRREEILWLGYRCFRIEWYFFSDCDRVFRVL